MKKPKRRLAAIMFTDIVGYSAMMQKDEVLSNRLRVKHKEAFNRITEEYGGKILQYFGDGTLSIFKSTAAAVECGVALQKEMKKEPPVPIRIGIHTGDVTYSKEEAYGDGVNVAARIESLAVPGGIYISEKVYDDIKNHSWLTAKSIGSFDLKNIQNSVNVYAVNNEGITVPEPVPAKRTRKKPVQQNLRRTKRKRKFKAGLLALLFGVFGVHRFYLQQRNYGLVYLTISLVAIFVNPFDGMMGIMGVIAFVDAILFWTMSRDQFDAKYNPELFEKEAEFRAEKSNQKDHLQSQYSIFFKRAEEHYDDYRYEEAAEELRKAVQIKYDEPEAHFFLACCYSFLENVPKAFSHLDAAVAFGLKDTDRIQQHPDLAFLRTQSQYDLFKNNGFRTLEELPPLPKQDKPAKPSTDDNLLEQLNQLHKLYLDGILTEEEYLKQEEQMKSKGLE